MGKCYDFKKIKVLLFIVLLLYSNLLSDYAIEANESHSQSRITNNLLQLNISQSEQEPYNQVNHQPEVANNQLIAVNNSVTSNVYTPKNEEKGQRIPLFSNPELEEAKPSIELAQKRTRNSKTYLNKDGTITVQTATYSLHYLDRAEWKDIDTTIQEDHTDPSYSHSMLTNNFKVRLQNKGAKQAVTFAVYDQSVTYRALGLNTVTGDVYGNTITYANAWKNTDLIYQTQNDELKMELHLADKNAPKTYQFEMETNLVTPHKNADGSIDFVDSKGNASFRIPQLWVQDASSAEKRYDRLQVDIKEVGSRSIISITLDDKGLQYPIVIDPTTEYLYAIIPTIIVPEGSIQLSGASYEIYVYGVNSSATQVRFPTWTETNGQDDIKWYNGTNLGDGIWKVTVPFKDHNFETGNYITHVYIDNISYAVPYVKVVHNAKVTLSEKIEIANGSYEVFANGIGINAARVFFPTWTSVNDQDDVKWYEGINLGSGTWKAIVPFSDHMYETGSYITHVYAYDTLGNSVFAGGTTINVSNISQPGNVPFSQASYDVFAYGVSPNASKVQFPTWTNANGQDDLKWYDGQNLGNGIWKVTVPFKSHNYETGAYNTHVYADGTAIGGTSANVIMNATVSPSTNVDYSKGSYDVYANNIGSGAAKVLFPTWTSLNDQDDLKWYEGINLGNGTWKATVPFNDHKSETGTYVTHVYTYDKANNSVFIGQSNTNVFSSISNPGNVSLSQASYDVYAYGVPLSAKQVQFPSWTDANGQDDIKWYNGKNIGNGVWKVTVPFKDHYYETGIYITHVYVDGAGIGGTSANVSMNVTTSSPANVDYAKGSYEIYAYGVGAGTARVVFPTWTSINGQDDIRWHEGIKIGNGIWKAVVPFSEHKSETGNYITHIYAHDNEGNSIFIGGTTANVYASVSKPDNVSLYQNSHDVYAYGVPVSSTQVQFPTWSNANGQDDLIWYNGQNLGNGVWKITIPFSDHHYDTGVYFTDVYVNGLFFGGTTANVTLAETATSVSTPGDIDFANGSYEVYAYGVAPHMTRVLFSTWTNANNQDDIKWYEGINLGNGTWKAVVLFSDHKSETGNYITHIYGYDKFSNSVFISGNSVNVYASVSKPGNVSLSQPSYDVYAYGVPLGATQVQFPTWTSSNGQDDLKWYNGQNLGNGIWKVSVPFTDHNNETGLYYTHIYMGGTFFGGTTATATNHPTNNYYDTEGRLDHVKSPTGKVLKYQYDKNGNLLKKAKE